MTYIVDNPEQWPAVRDALKPVSIRSRTHGDIPVPCANTILAARDLLVANAYNPNFVPDEKLALLRQSILDNGFAFPVIVIWDEDLAKFVVVDGFHRTLIGGAEWLDFDRIPVAVLGHGPSQRMTATIQFNKARGVHQVDLDAEVIRALIEQGLGDDEISLHLGIDLDTVHRYKQITGVAELFANTEWSRSWGMSDD